MLSKVRERLVECSWLNDKDKHWKEKSKGKVEEEEVTTAFRNKRDQTVAKKLPNQTLPGCLWVIVNSFKEVISVFKRSTDCERLIIGESKNTWP